MVKVVLRDFQGPFVCIFLDFSMSFPDCLIEWISNKSDFCIHLLNQSMKAQDVACWICNTVHN